MSVAHFNSLYASNPDPWNVTGSWYEQRKIALVLASLPDARHSFAYEPACGTGEMTAQLARRCDKVLASDSSPHAVEAARKRTADLPNVEVAQHVLPEAWPPGDGQFDLVVISELGYYLQPAALGELASRCAASLRPGGTLVACHSLLPFDDRLLRTPMVHDTLSAALARAHPAGTGASITASVRHDEPEFRIEVWRVPGLARPGVGGGSNQTDRQNAPFALKATR